LDDIGTNLIQCRMEMYNPRIMPAKFGSVWPSSFRKVDYFNDFSVNYTLQ